MTSDIVAKLNRALSVPMTREEQVVYILVGTRKLLERSGQRKTWAPVAFLCDWALHIEIDRHPWSNELLKRVEAAALNNTSFISLSAGDQEFFQQNLTLSAVRDAMMKFLAAQGVKSVCLGHTIGWYSFVLQLAEIVKHCPLILRGGGEIEQVQLELVKGNASGTRLDMEWTFVLKGGKTFKQIAPTLFAPPEFHFGRGGEKSNQAFEALLHEAGLMRPWEDDVPRLAQPPS